MAKCSVGVMLALAALVSSAYSYPLTLQECSSNFAYWHVHARSAIVAVNTSLCATLAADPNGNANTVALSKCEPDNLLQAWEHRTDGRIQSLFNQSLCWSLDKADRINIESCEFANAADNTQSFIASHFRISATHAPHRCVSHPLALNYSVAGLLDVTQAPCLADPTGNTDSTAAIQRCISLAYSADPLLTVFFPVGTYRVSDTIVLQQANGRPGGPNNDDGINVVPARYLAYVVMGSTSALPKRPRIVLADNSPGFNNVHYYKPVVFIFEPSTEGLDMNNVFRGIDFDLGQGNAGAVGIFHGGAQGTHVADLTVYANDAFACFAGMNGAGGMHAAVTCIGGQYGFYVDNSQPVPVAVGVQLINQTTNAIMLKGQQTLSLVGSRIVTAPGALSALVTTCNWVCGQYSLFDVTIECASSSTIAVDTTQSLYAANVYVKNCGTVVKQPGISNLNNTAKPEQWFLIREYAKGVNPTSFQFMDMIYTNGQPKHGASIVDVESPAASDPPADLYSRHIWDTLTFPSFEDKNAADVVRDCGAKGDDTTDDTAALQTCIDQHDVVFVPPGHFRITRTLRLRAGTVLFGIANSRSFILVSTHGMQDAQGRWNSPSSRAEPTPLIRTATNDRDAAPTTIAFLGLYTWHHIPGVYVVDWQSQNPASIWRVNYETREAECLWVTYYQKYNPPQLPCNQLPVNLSIPKSVFSGLGRIYSFVNDEDILYNGKDYRHILISGVRGDAANRLRLYSLNLEHAQSETNGEVVDSSFVDIYSIKAEGSLPILWIRDADNVQMLGFGGGLESFPFNYTYPSDFTQYIPSLFRIGENVRNISLANLIDYGRYGPNPFWPPLGGCEWLHFYPFDGPPFPNVSMWNCWYGATVAGQYWHMITDYSSGTQITSDFQDRPVLYRVE